MKNNHVLITGASGLLGSAIVRRLGRERSIIPLGLTHASTPRTAVDFFSPRAMADLDALEWDSVIHCAAYRSPDFCEAEPEKADILNARVPKALAELARRRRARMIHISTDYVFPGTKPPYGEDDPPQPVNRYGLTKLEAEHGVLTVCPDAVVVRIPALYGNPEPPLVSPLLEEGIQAVLAGEKVELDDRIVRFPTFTDDVAEVIAFILDHSFAGLLHVSGGQKATRYQWACAVAHLLGRPIDHLCR